ncbi:hypothetical protein HG537_0D05410 [Torulaspora globosa]|uniref:AMP-activated protein kinase glycogen-binding domain-containing protein n=1 Tax=Torulaspora globosa TaxID=48254 RepID=A0A7H9HT57_9SACH|nr:hypothetical protein HG537_0D05410 [Torulaspora sp. CBS 2947]
MSNILFVIPTEVLQLYSSPTDKIVITGEFDDWKHSDYVLEYYGDEGYKVEIPRINGKDKTMFKLVINDREWITLSYFETAVDDSGHTNNVLNYHDYELDESLDDVTIGSVRQENEQQKQLLSFTAEVTEDHFLPSEILSTASAPQAGLNDYVNISSYGELSSTEDLEFTCDSDLGLEETIQYDSNVSFGSNQRPLDGLVSMVNRARTYWHA